MDLKDMQLEDMTLEQVTERLADLDKEVRGMTKVEDVEAAKETRQTLLDRKAELEDLAARKQEILDLQSGKTAPVRIFEKREGIQPMEKLTYAVDSKEYRSAFLRSLMGQDLSVEERAAVSASAAIPTLTWNKIVEKMEMIAPLYGKVTTSQIAGNITIPVESATADASWVAMGTASTDSEDGITSVTLSAYKLIKTVEIGADVENMSIDAFESYIVGKLDKKIAKAVEAAIVNGAGSTEPTGLVGSITNTGTFTMAGMTYDDLLTIVSDLPDDGYRQNASFVMPSALFYGDVLPALTDKGSGLDVQAVEKKKVFNYDVILCDRMPEDTLIFGDLSYYHFNWAKAPVISADNSVAFRTGSTVYRALGLADGKPTNVAAFNKYTRALS